MLSIAAWRGAPDERVEERYRGVEDRVHRRTGAVGREERRCMGVWYIFLQIWTVYRLTFELIYLQACLGSGSSRTAC